MLAAKQSIKCHNKKMSKMYLLRFPHEQVDFHQLPHHQYLDFNQQVGGF